MSVRISASDWAEGGNDAEEAIAIARAFREHGVDIVDVSTGQVVSEEAPRYGRLWQTPYSERVRLEADVPTMSVGAISGYGDANSIIAGGRADLCVLARAHLFDPYWTRHAAYEQGWTLEWPDQYKSLARYTHHFD
jgi:anthraniloyl-CoA monooxygenase